MTQEFLSLPDKLDFGLGEFLLIIDALAIIFTCYRLIIAKNLFESVINLSIFSLLIGLLYLLTDAPDVAMTETALNACLSTCVLLNIVKITGEECRAANLRIPTRIPTLRIISASIVCLILIAILIPTCLDLPEFGSSSSPVQTHLTKYYLENTESDISIPSFTAAILASYRGYDTLGETTVILIAGLSTLLISSRKKN